ncbi:hypothetical protein [Parvibaculum sp.]|uniref:hypothetical protein n=1 Tax=Parvibaculum sp. TaxID=2024848 RepID=UPI00320F12F0
MKIRLWRTPSAFAMALTATLFIGAPVAAAEINAEVMQKWATVTVVHYAVTGDYSADALIVNAGTNGYAPVKDRVEVSFDWDQTEAKLVGEPIIKNLPTEIGALRNGAAGCRAPALNGKYEHFTLLSLKEGLGGQLAMSVRRDYPAAAMPVACTGGSESVPARSTTENADLAVPGTMILAMPVEPGSQLTVSSDGKSMIVVDKGWTWTYTPTPVR